MPPRLPQQIIKLLTQNKRRMQPERLVDELLKEGFADRDVRRGIWDLLASREIEYTPDRLVVLKENRVPVES